MDYQEPMMLGSPVSHTSPSNTSVHQISSGQFCPGFLMGDPTITTTPVLTRSKSGGHSHSAYLNSPVFGNYASRSSPPSNPLSPQNKYSQLTSKEKGGAPPVSGLLEENNSFAYPSPALDVTSSGRSGITDLLGRSSAAQYHDISRTPRQHNSATPRRILPNSAKQDTSSFKTPPSPAQLDPFYTQGENLTSNVEIDETWVTIFGFPPTASSYILQQFSRCGVILEHHSPGAGNWMHVRFESKLQAKRALSKSGKIFADNLMIGVAQCIDVKVMYAQPQGTLSSTNTSILTEANTSISHTPNALFQANNTRLSSSGRGINSPKPCTIRPLTAAYNAAGSGNRVVNDVKTPQKTNGIMTKAMDYIFG